MSCVSKSELDWNGTRYLILDQKFWGCFPCLRRYAFFAASPRLSLCRYTAYVLYSLAVLCVSSVSLTSLDQPLVYSSRLAPWTPHHFARMGPTTRKIAAGSSSPNSKPEQAADAGDQLFNKDGSLRKSRVLRRKTDHSIIERRRREKINEKLVALQNIVPACRKECQDLFERKFAAPLRATDDDDGTATKRNAKRRREEEKLDKAKTEMSEKIRTTMVLEKLCIISHSLDFVIKLQEENKALRALCDCQGQADRRASMSSDVELDEHYRSAHSRDGEEEEEKEGLARRISDASEEGGKQASLSPSASLELDSVGGVGKDRPMKRRLHWGSDDVREASIRRDTCRHRCCAQPQVEAETPSSPVEAELDCDAVGERMDMVLSPTQELNRSLLPCSSIPYDHNACNSFCRTRHSCCRSEEQEESEDTTEASDDLTSPPPSSSANWPALAPSSHVAYLGRQRLPSITNLGLPKHDASSTLLRQDALASLYRSDMPRVSDAATSRRFRPLSLYTSHATAPSALGTRQ